MARILWAAGLAGLAGMLAACTAAGLTEAELREHLTYWEGETNYLPPPPQTKEELRREIERCKVDFPPLHLPVLHGTVVLCAHDRLAHRDRLAVRLDEEPPRTWPQRIVMAVLGVDGDYKGEFAVRILDSGYAFGSLIFLRAGRTVQIGDRVTCNP